jgi:hypothetical protein
MRPVTTTLLTATFAAACVAAIAPLAFASPARVSPERVSPERVSDVQFIEANRCLGLMSSKAFGGADTSALQHFIKVQSWGRDSYVYDRADQARDDANREAGRGGTDRRAKLTAEVGGVCQTYVADTSTASAASPARSLQ